MGRTRKWLAASAVGLAGVLGLSTAFFVRPNTNVSAQPANKPALVKTTKQQRLNLNSVTSDYTSNLTLSVTTAQTDLNFPAAQFNYGGLSPDLKYATSGQLLSAVNAANIGALFSALAETSTTYSGFDWVDDVAYSNFASLVGTNAYTATKTQFTISVELTFLRNVNSFLADTAFSKFFFAGTVPVNFKAGESVAVLLTLTNLAIPLTQSDEDLMQNGVLNMTYPDTKVNNDVATTKIQIWQDLTPWLFNSGGQGASAIANYSGSYFENYFLAMLFYSPDINYFNTTGGAESFNDSVFPASVTFDLPATLGTQNLQSVILSNVKFTNLTNDYLVYPDGMYFAPNSAKTGNINSASANAPQTSFSVLNLSYLFEKPQVSTALDAQELTPNTLWQQTPEYLLKTYGNTGLTSDLASFYGPLFNEAGAYIESIKPVALTTSQKTFLPDLATYNNILPLQVEFAGTSRFIGFLNSWITNNAENDSDTVTYFAPSQLYGPLMLSDISSGILTDSTTTNFNTIYLYNLNSAWLMSDLNLVNNDVYDLEHKTIDELKQVSQATWAGYLADSLAAYNTTHGTDLLWYGAPENITFGTTGYQITKQDGKWVLGVPIVNNANTAQLVNGVLIPKKSTTVIYLPLLNYTVSIDANYVILALVLALLFVLAGFGLSFWWNRKTGRIVKHDYDLQIQKWRQKDLHEQTARDVLVLNDAAFTLKQDRKKQKTAAVGKWWHKNKKLTPGEIKITQKEIVAEDEKNNTD